MTSTQTTVGFMGLGIMGSRMALNLARKGLQVVVWNRTPARAQALVPHGLKVADSPRSLCEQVQVVCTSVADPAALHAVMHGPDGALAAARQGQLFIDFSTVSPEDTRALEVACAQRGADFVESPVTGSKGGAEQGTLVLMVGATDQALERARPVLEIVGNKLIHCGPVGSASQVKLAGNALITLMLQGLSEGLMLTRKAGVDPRKFLEVVQASGYRSPYFDFKGGAILARNFETHFSVDLMFKDLNLFLQSAAHLRVPTPGAGAMREVYQIARAAGLGDKDICAVITAFESLGGSAAP